MTTDLKWFMEQQELRDRVSSKLADMGIQLNSEDEGEVYDTEEIVEEVFKTMLMIRQFHNGLIYDGSINDDYTTEMFYIDMLIIQVIRYISSKHGWDIEMDPIYDEDDEDDK
jgi:hypothetical protein